MDRKSTLYLAIACGVLVLILLVVVVLVMTSGGNPAAPAVAAAAAAGAAEAARRRNVALSKVQEAGQAVSDTVQEITTIKATTDSAVAEIPKDVARMSDEQLQAEGNRLFGGKP